VASAVVVLATAALPLIAASQAHAAETLTPPTITGPSGTIASTSATISVTPASQSHIVDCYYNGEEINCPGTWTYTDLPDGPHTVTAQARTASGDTSPVVSVYWKVDTTGPVANVIPPASLSTHATVSLSENSTGVTGSSVQLAYDGGAVIPTTRQCVSVTLEPTPCSGSSVRKVYVTPQDGWVLGARYVLRVNPTGSATVADTLGNVALPSTATFGVQTTVQESAVPLTWRSTNSAKARGGSYLVERRAGASLTYSFNGSRLTWLTMTGPAHGKAELYIDGRLIGSFNNYSERVKHGVERTLTGLGSGSHTAELRVLGRKGARAGTGTLIAVDGFVTSSRTDGTPEVTQRWQRVANDAASNGYYAVADLAGQTATMSFRGTSVTLHTAHGPRFGEVGLVVDGELVRTVDLYGASLQLGHEVTVSGLEAGAHTLTVKVLGSKRATSGGTGVVVDAISAS
jgi:hypothetical protein